MVTVPFSPFSSFLNGDCPLLQLPSGWPSGRHQRWLGCWQLIDSKVVIDGAEILLIRDRDFSLFPELGTQI